jgi:hypothetical protein
VIIGRDEMYDVAAFRAGLEAAINGIVRVKIDSERAGSGGSLCTGWLITDDLVVVPDFVAPADAKDDTYSCQHGSQTIPAVIVSRSSDPDRQGPTLLRLSRQLEGHALSLASEVTEEHQQVFLLHHPRGAERLHISIGRLIGTGQPWLRYDADTVGGSSGAPILNAEWIVIGMHTHSNNSADSLYNEGFSVPGLLPLLRDSPAWEEIAERQKLADVTAIRVALEEPVAAGVAPKPDRELVRAAVSWTFDPETFSEHGVELLRPLVAEPDASRWSLKTDTREAVLNAAGSLTALRRARGRSASTHPGQQVIDRILAGPPYPLAEIDESALPYWLQATRWFADVAPTLPSPADVNRTLERRRARSRLEDIGGAHFRGREDTLAELHDWYHDDASGPMVVTGIGGIGKSALVARFALDLPGDTLQLWLDFDRVDVAPDDAPSVLRLLFEQLAVQLEGFRAPTLDATSWPQAVAGLGPAVKRQLKGAPPPLLALDGFEVAQHVRLHREIWGLLELLLPQIPRLRVLVSGRAPVPDLVLGGRTARSVHLEGLAEPDAIALLREGGIKHKSVAKRVVEITRGVPLSLRLAVRWSESGGKISELPEDLPEQLVDGFLYQRILDRVIDQELKPVAQAALVLRRLTPDLISSVLSDTIPPDSDAADVFSRLTQEMALVADAGEAQALGLTIAGADVLRLRPEVRAATLRLLETDNRERVEMIDHRAANWYEKQDLEQSTNAAELVYHRLRLGDVRGAEAAWRDDCAQLLVDAAEELPEDADEARAWLRERTTTTPQVSDSLAAWERDAAQRIRDLLTRGVLTSVGAVLAERRERTAAGPLQLYDAWTHWSNGQVAEARELLETAAPDPIGRDRAVLAAWLAAQASDRKTADRHLQSIAATTRWSDRPEPELDALTVEAARVRLTVDVASELELSRSVDLVAPAPELLPSEDVVLPYLADRLGGTVRAESTAEAIPIPRDPSQLQACAVELDRIRARSGRMPLLSIAREQSTDPWLASDLEAGNQARVIVDVGNDTLERALDLAVLGWRRWRLATTTLFLARTVDLALEPDAVAEPQRLSIVGTLAAFATRERSSFMLTHESGRPLNDIVAAAASTRMAVSLPSAAIIAVASSVLQLYLGATAIDAFLSLAQKALAPQTLVRSIGLASGPVQNLVIHLLSPDPLELLMRRVVGIPDTLPLPTQP